MLLVINLTQLIFNRLCDFDWKWPTRCDRAAVEALITFEFLREANSVVLQNRF